MPLHDLRKRPRNRRPVLLEVLLDGLAVADSRVDPSSPVVVDVEIESAAEGVTVAGAVEARWLGSCNLCLDEVSGELSAHVNELYADSPLDEETYKLDAETLDLGPLVNDAVLLELPVVVRCPFGGIGHCDRVPEELARAAADAAQDDDSADERPLADPRWAALNALEFDEG
ncbi:MAG: YceD family protein [Acidimicrobiales bacterium]